MPDYAYDFESPVAEYFWTHNIEVESIEVSGAFTYYQTSEGKFVHNDMNDNTLNKWDNGVWRWVNK